MSSKSAIDHFDGKRVNLGVNHEKLTKLNLTCRNSAVDCFKNKSMEFYTKQLDDKSVRTYNTLSNKGK